GRVARLLDMTFPSEVLLFRNSFIALLLSITPSFSGSVIFLHPDGTGLGHWNAMRLLTVGPDGITHWDSLERLAAYRPHQKNWLSTTSHAGATVHAYGKKVHHDSFGMDRDQPILSASGSPLTILQEAQSYGVRTGIVNSGHIAEPGTAVFVASSESRKNTLEIAASVMESGTDVIFAGGELQLIPENAVGHFGLNGLRTDGRNLLKEAEERGYKVIFTREELRALGPETEKVIGIFAPGDTYNFGKEIMIQKMGVPLYRPDAPTIAEMTAAALRVLGEDPSKEFFLIAEEEGTDNFSNSNNAAGMLEAAARADEAIGIALEYLSNHPDRDTLLLVASDSDAGHPTVFAPREVDVDTLLPERDDNGAPIHGPDGIGGAPFVSLPDSFGNRHPFGIAWATYYDFPGSVVAKANGYQSESLGSDFDNTDIYQLIRKALFGSDPLNSEE
ncbi:MAG: alkaline phosphatase, partial [Verrucomicrobiota bacterium]